MSLILYKYEFRSNINSFITNIDSMEYFPLVDVRMRVTFHALFTHSSLTNVFVEKEDCVMRAKSICARDSSGCICLSLFPFLKAHNKKTFSITSCLQSQNSCIWPLIFDAISATCIQILLEGAAKISSWKWKTKMPNSA